MGRGGEEEMSAGGKRRGRGNECWWEGGKKRGKWYDGCVVLEVRMPLRLSL